MQSGQRTLLTKLHPPALNSLMMRPGLLEHLINAVLSHRLTLLSAPAGYGKTSVLGLLSHTIPVAWLSLDEGENDPSVLLAHLYAALRKLAPACAGSAGDSVWASYGSQVSINQVVRRLIDDVLHCFFSPLVLVLDNLQTLTSSQAYMILGYLLEWMPDWMHVVIGARYNPPLPLSRLRGRGALAEFRAEDLRFSLQDTERFLNEWHRLALSSPEMDYLFQRTEGWPVGLSLFAMSRHENSRRGKQETLLETWARARRYIFDFFAEQVMAYLSPSLRLFLLETSIVSELTVPLCNAVTGREDAAVYLEKLTHRGLFVQSVGERGQAWRYHSLFAEFLRYRLEHEFPSRLRMLHRRAAEVLPLNKAIDHYVAAGMWEEAVVVIEALGPEWVERGRLRRALRLATQLPERLYRQHPKLLHLLGRAYYEQGEIEQARKMGEEAWRFFALDENAQGEGVAALLLADCALVERKAETGRQWIQRTLLSPLPPRWKVRALMDALWWELLWGQLPDAAARLQEVSHLLFREEMACSLLYVAAEYLSPLLSIVPGGLGWMERILHLMPYCDEIASSSLYRDGMLAFVYLWRGKIGAAVEMGQRLEKAMQRLENAPQIDLDIAATMGAVWFVRRDFSRANWWFMQGAKGAGRVSLSRAFLPGLFYLRGKMEVARDNIAGALSALDEIEAFGPIAMHYVRVLRLMLRAWIEMVLPPAERDLNAAKQWSREAQLLSRRDRFSKLFGEPRLIEAYVAWKQGRPKEAMHIFLPFLIECERDRTPGRLLVESPFVQPLLALAIEEGRHAPYAARLLRLLEASHPLRVPATGEVLTRREVEVLRLLAAGAGNRLIAERLSISEHTVKSHIVHILRKLDVTSRTQAALQARALGLAPFPENQSFGG